MLKPEDYLEPTCPFCTDGLDGKKPVHAIDVCRMTEKLDDYLSRNDYAAAERHLKFWLDEARFNNDDRGTLAVLNELMGLHRKCGHREAAISATEQALSLLERLNYGDSPTAGTTKLNAATVYKAFGMAQAALPLYEDAARIYESSLPAGDARFGGLYNNMALALADLQQFRAAEAYYERALSIMSQVEHGEPEMAITWLNLADLAEAELGLLDSEERVTACLDRAEQLLDTPQLPRNGNYAFVCEKCASTFDYFGRFAYANELKERARAIYERT